jgi:hypothetical protein
MVIAEKALSNSRAETAGIENEGIDGMTAQGIHTTKRSPEGMITSDMFILAPGEFWLDITLSNG